jgi:hypothetical protein
MESRPDEDIHGFPVLYFLMIWKSTEGEPFIIRIMGRSGKVERILQYDMS